MVRPLYSYVVNEVHIVTCDFIERVINILEKYSRFTINNARWCYRTKNFMFWPFLCPLEIFLYNSTFIGPDFKIISPLHPLFHNKKTFEKRQCITLSKTILVILLYKALMACELPFICTTPMLTKQRSMIIYFFNDSHRNFD